MTSSYKLAARPERPEGTRIRIGNVEIGGAEFVVAGGPCDVESIEMLEATYAR